MKISDKIFSLKQYRNGLTSMAVIEEDNYRRLSRNELLEIHQELHRVDFEIRALRTIEKLKEIRRDQ